MEEIQLSADILNKIFPHSYNQSRSQVWG